MHQVIYNNKLEHKCTLTPLNPRLLYVVPIQAMEHLSIRYTSPDLYIYLSVLCALYLAACGAAGHLSVLCNVGQLWTSAMQYWAASNVYYSDFTYYTSYLYYFSLIFIKIIYYCDIFRLLNYLFSFYTLKALKYHNLFNIYRIEIKRKPLES